MLIAYGIAIAVYLYLYTFHVCWKRRRLASWLKADTQKTWVKSYILILFYWKLNLTYSSSIPFLIFAISHLESSYLCN